MSGANARTEVVLYTYDAGTTWYFMLHSDNISGGGSGASNLSDITIDLDLNGTYKVIFDADADTYIIADTEVLEFSVNANDYINVEMVDGGFNMTVMAWFVESSAS